VVQQIVTQILSDALAPGASLPSEATLAQQFAVSRTVIREAVRVLASKGLIAVKHGSGMQVQPSNQWNYLDPLVLFKQLRVKQDESVLDDLLELRR
jgi:GntR family transcriptional repressor for pyruvate dehydrogenase complex